MQRFVLSKGKRQAFQVRLKVVVSQPEAPEEDVDIRGGGQAAEDRRVAKDDAYDSDNEVDSRGDVAWRAAIRDATSLDAKHGINRSIAAAAAAEDDMDSSGAPAPRNESAPQDPSIARDLAAEPQGGNVGGQIAPLGGILGTLCILQFSPFSSRYCWLALPALRSLKAASARLFWQ